MIKTLLMTKDFRAGEAISEHCRSLASYLDHQGIGVEILCFEKEKMGVEGVDVHSVDFLLDSDNIYDWTMLMNNELKREARHLFKAQDFDLIHAHEWTTLPAAMALKSLYKLPLVVTIHSTENNRGFGGPHGALISEMEYSGAKEADLLVVPNEKVSNSLKFDLNCPPKKIVQVDPFQAGWQDKIVEEYRQLGENQ